MARLQIDIPDILDVTLRALVSEQRTQSTSGGALKQIVDQIGALRYVGETAKADALFATLRTLSPGKVTLGSLVTELLQEALTAREQARIDPSPLPSPAVKPRPLRKVKITPSDG